MDKLKKTIELIESHQNPLDHYVVDPGVNLTVKEMFDVLMTEIERLKEIITLKDKLLIAYRMGPVHSVKIEKVLDRLQALKED